MNKQKTILNQTNCFFDQLIFPGTLSQVCDKPVFVLLSVRDTFKPDKMPESI